MVGRMRMQPLAARAGSVLHEAFKEIRETNALASPSLRLNMKLESEILGGHGKSKRLLMGLPVLKGR